MRCEANEGKVCLFIGELCVSFGGEGACVKLCECEDKTYSNESKMVQTIFGHVFLLYSARLLTVR